MRQTLFFIPHEAFGIPLFGWGWLLLIWLLFSAGWLILMVRKQGWSAEAIGFLPFMALLTVVIVFVIPMFEAKSPSGERLGLPIRGYGSFVLAGFASGFWLTITRARRRGINAEVISSLAVWMFVAAFVGARLFFVIEYWEDFRRETWSATLVEVTRITEGGLVVYGALLGGLPALFIFCRKHSIPPLLLGDVVAPGLALGLALGRLGCLMNGCCYGGICDDGWPVAMQFPRYNSVIQRSMSPPYHNQLATGRFHGFTLGTDRESKQPIVQSVLPDSLAEDSGLTAGDKVASLNGVSTPTLDAAKEVLSQSGPRIEVKTVAGKTMQWNMRALPPRSLRVHPVQIYSSVNAFLICFVLIAAEPFLRRQGAVLALTLTIYPIVRVIEEMIRVDEPPQFGTGLSISQIISVGLLLGAACLWAVVLRGKTAAIESRANRGQQPPVA